MHQQTTQPHEAHGMQETTPMGLRLQDVETPQQQAAISDLTRAIQVCEWCADQCIQLGDPNMTACIRHCQDVSTLGTTALTLIPRQSRQTHQYLPQLNQALQACAQECQQHRHAHCQECAQLLPQVAQSLYQFADVTQ